MSARAQATGFAWRAAPCPVEFLSLTGKRGAQLRATVSSFGPLLLAKVLGLNETQTSVLSMVFKWSDDRELELLAAAGIPNADVVRIATSNAALSLRRLSEFGTVEVGKRADLVVLDADPIADIKNTRRISWVIQDGKMAKPESFLPKR